MTESTAKFLSVAQVAARWDCSKTTVYDEIRSGRLRAMTLGAQSKRIAIAEVERFENERTAVAS